MKKQWMTVSVIGALVTPFSFAWGAGETGQLSFHDTMKTPHAIACSISSHVKERSLVSSDDTASSARKSGQSAGGSAR